MSSTALNINDNKNINDIKKIVLQLIHFTAGTSHLRLKEECLGETVHVNVHNRNLLNITWPNLVMLTNQNSVVQ